MQKMILVIGGTGMLGQPVARRLKEAGFGVRILTRDSAKARKLFDASFEVVAGDPLDGDGLEPALAGCQGVHISLPSEVELEVAEKVAQAASRRGVERLSYISGATVAEANRYFPMVDRKFRVEQALRESGVPTTIFCPTWVMEGLALFVRQGQASVLGQQPTPYHWVAADDCAQMVAEAYSQSDAANKRYFVFGPEAITMREALRRYCAVFHPEVKSVGTMPFWLVSVLAALMRDRGLKAAGEMMAYFEKAGEGVYAGAPQPPLAAPATTLEGWMKKRKEGRGTATG